MRGITKRYPGVLANDAIDLDLRPGEIHALLGENGAGNLVLGEPTAVLTPQETEEIFAVLRRLAADGHSIIFISHKLYEVLEIADRITVIRRGRVVGERIPAETNEEELAEMMVGRNV